MCSKYEVIGRAIAGIIENKVADVLYNWRYKELAKLYDTIYRESRMGLGIRY